MCSSDLLMFDYVLTGPISAVSAGQYLVGMFGNLLALPPLYWQLNADAHPELVKFLSMLIAIGITLYFWRINIIGIHESSQKAMRIMQLTTVMGVIVFAWACVTLWLRPELQHLPPFRLGDGGEGVQGGRGARHGAIIFLYWNMSSEERLTQSRKGAKKDAKRASCVFPLRLCGFA